MQNKNIFIILGSIFLEDRPINSSKLFQLALFTVTLFTVLFLLALNLNLNRELETRPVMAVPAPVLTISNSVSSAIASATHSAENIVTKTAESTSAKTVPTGLTYKSGVIRHSLSGAIQNAGLSAHFTTQLVNMFSGKINFSRDLHPGDRFNVLYQYDSKTHSNQIEIAQFVINKKPTTVVRYTDPKGHSGFYTPAGDSLQESLTRFPLHFREVSSPFSYRRLDPVLHVYRPHLGVDLAAPSGTPVKAIGDGQVEFVGVKTGYGNTIIIRYNSRYETLYAHLSRFALHLHRYSAVKSGQVVGYVGCTGYCTGSHLHYEIHVRGVPENPLRVSLPTAPGVPRVYLARFKAYANALEQQLKTHSV